MIILLIDVVYFPLISNDYSQDDHRNISNRIIISFVV